MPSPFATACWPSWFFARWLAVFFGAALVGMALGAMRHKPTTVIVPPPKLVQIRLQAKEIYVDGTEALVPADVATGGTGAAPLLESDQGPLSTSPSSLTAISREPGSTLWLIYTWQGATQNQHINPWPKSSLTYTIKFRLNRPNPHPNKS